MQPNSAVAQTVLTAIDARGKLQDGDRLKMCAATHSGRAGINLVAYLHEADVGSPRPSVRRGARECPVVTMTVVKRLLLMVGSLVLVVSVTVRSGAAASSAPRMLVPAYFDPPSHLWTKALSSPDQTILIVNPDNGPGRNTSPAYTRLISHARADGHELIGYVYTRYGARPIATVEGQINRWASFYGVHDIFFDEVAQSAAHLSYYRTVTDYASAHGAKVIVLNPGTVPARGYFGLGAIVVTFEDTYAAYQHAQFPPWLRREPASQQANIVYAVPSTPDARATLAAMHGHGVGTGYVTGAGAQGSDPYSTLPPYYDRETDWLGR